MYNTMTSIGKHIVENAAEFGLTSAEDLKTIGATHQALPDGARWLVMHAVRTVPNHTADSSFGHGLITGPGAERFLTQIKFEVRTRSPEPGSDFLWDTARQFRDKVYGALKNAQPGGKVIPRYDWSDPENPLAAGEIWFEVNPSVSPVEENLEDPQDPANKSIFLTYQVHWWRPAPTLEPAEQDPWLEALMLWTRSRLGEGWTISGSDGLETLARPAVLWNLTGISTKQSTGSLYEVSKKFTGRIFGRVPHQHAMAALSIMEGLGRDVKMILNAAEKKYAAVVNPQMEIPSNNLREAQVTVELTRKTPKPEEEVALMMKVKTEGSWQ